MDKRAISKERQRERFYRSARAVVRRALKQYSADFANDLKHCTSLQQMQQVASKQVRSNDIEKAIRQIYAPVGKYFGEQTYKELKPAQKRLGSATINGLTTPITEDYWFAWVEKMLKGSLGQRITWITGTTRESFIKAVDSIGYDGFEKGKSIDVIASEIMKELRITELYRAERIARTEVISASNMSSQAGAQATGLELNKEWIAYLDENTRESHAALNGSVVDMNEQFSNGLDVPGDASGDAEEVINCRCTVGYLAKEGAEYSWGREI